MILTFLTSLLLQTTTRFANGQSISLTFSELEKFYDPPTSYEREALGAVLKYRDVTLPNYLSNISSGAYQLLYRTESAEGAPEADVTTFFLPKSGDAENAKIVSYHVPEDATYLGCAPSYTLLSNSSSQDSTLLGLLEAGFYVNVPDYEGPNSSFTAGIKAGVSVLDSLRAVLDTNNGPGFSSDTPMALWGYSGGSIAAGWAAQLHQHYAPELNIVGSALGGYVVNLTATVLAANQGFGAGFIPAGLIGLASQYTEFAEIAEENLYSQNSSVIQAVKEQCLEEDLIMFFGKNVFEYLKSGRAFMDIPEIAEVLNNQTLGHTAPDAPMFIYQGTKDEIAPVDDVDRAVSSYCSLGATVDYWVNPTATHVAQATAGFSYALDWVSSRLDGINANCACTSITGSSPVTASVCSTGTLGNSTVNSTATGTRSSTFTSAVTSSGVGTGSVSGSRTASGAAATASGSSGSGSSSSSSLSSQTSDRPASEHGDSWTLVPPTAMSGLVVLTLACLM